MLDPEVQLVLDTMMRVAFPGHTEFATSKLARELAKQIMEQVKSPRWVQQLDGSRACCSCWLLAATAEVLAQTWCLAAEQQRLFHRPQRGASQA